MATLAEMSCAPAEPLRHRATVPALEFDEVSTVHLTILLPVFDTDRRTRATYQFLRLKHLLFLLSTDAILLAAEIGCLTFEALVVSELEHRPFL